MKSLLALGLVLGLLAGKPCGASEKKGAKGAARPNVLLIMTDDQGYGDLSCHGNPILKTPNLDRLHGESIRLTDFHVAPMCTPTRGQLLTGVDALRNGAMNVSSGRTLLRRQFPTLADAFAAHDYRTGIFGKWHLGDNYPYRPQDRGFEESIWLPSSHTPSASDYWNNDYFDDVYQHNGVRKPFQGYCTDIFFREAMAWMGQCAERKQPFFCYLPLNAPHAPRFVPDRYREPYRHLKPHLASFFGMIANIDENLGKLEEFLRRAGLRDNTIVIFLTDNGTAGGDGVFNAGMRGRKIDLYDGGHRVPFFLRWPAGKLRPPGDLGVLTHCQDVFPTLLELCQLKKPARTRFDGVSLAKLLRRQTEELKDRMLVVQFSRMNDPVPARGDAAVLWQHWRLVGGKELFDIRPDPSQKENLFAEFPEVVAKMQKHYQRWWDEVQPELNQFSPIHLGSPRENPVMLTPCDWKDVFIDQQAQVRRVQTNGVWQLLVERAGTYRFGLRRWPREAGVAISAGAPQYKGVQADYAAGVALPVAKARLKIGQTDLALPVNPDAQEVSFSLALPRGPTELQTWFYDAQAKELCGAYYVYVEGPANSPETRN